ncbi:MAG: histidine kinase dimerization/phosphoacceptor domain -containing protein [Saprospiraceae bacterium]|nr:histidine kinase dimerization/phosphoacceptor domain -containing protein [Saprospiraceae bacterium]
MKYCILIVIVVLPVCTLTGQINPIDFLNIEDTAGVRKYIKERSLSVYDEYTVWGQMHKIAKRKYSKFAPYFYKMEVESMPDTLSAVKKVFKYTAFSVYSTNYYTLETALKNIYLAENIAETEDNDYLRARVMHALGWYYAANCEFKRSIETYDHALQIFTRLDKKKNIRNILVKKALALQLIEEHKEAFSIFEKVYHTDKIPSEGILSLLVKSSFRNGDIIKTQKYLNEYFAKIKENSKSKLNSHRYHILSAIQANIRNQDFKEEQHLIKAYEVSNKKNFYKEEFGAYLRLGIFYFDRKKFVKAKTCLKKAQSIAYEGLMYNRFHKPISILLQIAEIEKDTTQINDFTILLANYQKQITQKIEVNNIIENNKKDELIRQKREIQSQNQKIWTLITLGSIGVGLLLFAFFYFRKYTKIVKDLSQKNLLLDQSVNEKQTLLQETHHRVKNNLQIIASLLNLQRKYTKDKKLTSALIDGRNRVKSMALIHQLLYQKKDLKGINVRNYVENLMSSLFSSLKADKKNIQFINDVDPLHLHEDTLLAIGLIINEVVTNSLKYAFEERENGKIQISLLKKDPYLFLSISDNGIGIPEDFNINDKSSFGYSLITSLSKKLDAEISIFCDNGTTINLLINKFIETK